MPSLQIFVFLLAVADLVLAGLISNGFIATVTIREWTKCRRLASSEEIFLSLALSNICSTVLSILYFWGTYNNFPLFKIFPATFFAAVTRFWFTAWLCVFYCIKIVNSTHAFFLWCKMRISWLIPRLLIGSLALSFFVSFISVRIFPIELQSNTTANATSITQVKLKDYLGPFRLLFLIIGSGSPLIVVLFCSIMVIASLSRHVCRMASTTSSFKDLQTEAHIKAVRIVIFLLFLYVSYFMAQTISLVAQVVDMERTFISVVMIMYSPAQAAVLIFTNPKLKQAFNQLLKRKKSLEGTNRHIRRMRSEKSSFRSIQAEAHVKAAQTMLSLLFIYVLFYVGETLNTSISFGDGQQFSDVFVVLLYSHAQAAILVLVNSKLKRTATQILLRISQEQCRHFACLQT
ncbi:taste receptor type 2 member 9-like [Anolis sagrei]|uniref:taste receptor type 2 member 9-like n=1 Tax=Anolis sagrei TaxID=38937 RepID=UPI0035211234